MALEWKNVEGENYLVYTLEKGEKIDELAKGMLENNRIPGVLPFSFFQKDDECELVFPCENLTQKSIAAVDLEEENTQKELLQKTLEEYSIKTARIETPSDCRIFNQDGLEMFVVLPVLNEQTSRLGAYIEKMILK